MAISSVASATRVLPEPTSPCSRRCIGSAEDMSVPISASTRRWAPVRAWRCPAMKRASSVEEAPAPPGTTSRSAGSKGWRMPAAVSSRRRRRSASRTWSRKNSSKTRRRRASATTSRSAGRWIPHSEAVRSTRPRLARSASGRGSSRGPARRRASSTNPPSSQLVRPARAEAGYTGTIRPTLVGSRSSPEAPPPVLGDATEEEGLDPRDQLALAPGLVEEDHGEGLPVVAHHQLDEVATLAGAPARCAHHLGEDRRLLAQGHLGEVHALGAIEVAARVGRHQVEDVDDLHRGEGLLALGAHVAQLAHGDLRQLAESARRRGAHSMPKK